MANRKYNGGTTIGIGDYTLKYIEAYEPRWDPVVSKFTKYDFSTATRSRGNIFKLNVTAGTMTEDELIALKSALFKYTFKLTCSEFVGTVLLTAFQAPLIKCDSYGKYYKPRFSVEAVAPSAGSGNL